MEITSVEATGDQLQSAVEALREGRMAMLLDRDGSTAAGGHLVAAAASITAETVATMLREAAGMPFLALSEERCEALELSPIGAGGDMMVTIEARRGTTTGISASDRALTMRVGAGAAYTAVDVVKPGHVLPIRVPADRLLSRPDPAAVALELAALAGSPGGVTLCQVLDASGAPAAGERLEELAEELGIPLADCREVVENRLRATPLVTRDGDERILDTAIGPLRCVTYRGHDGARHFALVHGDPARPEPIHVETVIQDPPLDAFAADADEARPRAALTAMAAARRGVLLYLAPGEREDEGPDAAIARSRRAHLIRQILRDLGVAAITAEPGAD